jgi:hypothetical protein
MNNSESDYQSNAKLLRLKAEEQLKLTQAKTNLSESEPDNQKLVHELQVHQIELEMQNDELRVANEVAQIALKNYTMLYDLAPVGFFTLEQDGTITELNFTGAELLGDRRYSLVSNNFKLYVSEESKKTFNLFLQAVFTGIYKESCIVQLGYNGKTLKKVYIEGVFVHDENKCLLSVVDTSCILAK